MHVIPVRQAGARGEAGVEVPRDLETEVAALAPELIAFLRHHTGDHHLGADLAQDVLARAFRSLSGLRDPEALRGWLFRIAVNRFNDHVRRSRALRVDVGPVPEREAPAAERPDREAMASELDQVLRRELVKLPERQRTVLMLHGVRGMRQPEIAEILGISADAVKMSLFHAREKMRVRLAHYMERVPEKRHRHER
jgi:RNA polymerase sigma-70 factor (ECF subfamily)